MIDLVGHLACVLVLVGQLVAVRGGPTGPSGFLIAAVGFSAWVVVGAYLGMSSIIVWSAIGFFGQIIVFYHHSEQSK